MLVKPERNQQSVWIFCPREPSGPAVVSYHSSGVHLDRHICPAATVGPFLTRERPFQKSAAFLEVLSY